jgi:acetyl-CoA carboxylase carboxyl transferase subunit alpha
MTLECLEFERPIAELEQKIEELRRVGNNQEINLSEEISRLQQRIIDLKKSIFSSLNAHQIVQLARHPLRPFTLDYIERIFTDFEELHGDRHSSAGASIVGGLARLNGVSVVVIGHQKGRTTKEKVARNFGMASPEAFRKALRLMQLAEKFKIPVLTFLDTFGAYPGISAEEHNQSEAIARNLYVMSELKVPIISTVIGEGCSGGALAIGVSDYTFMLQYSYYSVISPEGCASILWKSAEKAADAAEALNLTAKHLFKLKLIDEIIEEPLGGAHRDVDTMAERVQKGLVHRLAVLRKKNIDELLDDRYHRLMGYGKSSKP